MLGFEAAREDFKIDRLFSSLTSRNRRCRFGECREGTSRPGSSSEREAPIENVDWDGGATFRVGVRVATLEVRLARRVDVFEGCRRAAETI